MMDSTIDVSLDQQQRDGRHLPSVGGGGGGHSFIAARPGRGSIASGGWID